ncbi:MAG: poly(A) polymerase, partial [Deltaproteobacteria bacterium]|nr:poly(A) polymerase [Deltaproteobacteria bacterium]
MSTQLKVSSPRPAAPSPGDLPARYSYEMSSEVLDLDALSVVQKLHRAGYVSYFVGGCVRDSLLGLSPKDFDIATSARPRDLKHVFRNCRLIGKRFTLAHVLFAHDKVIEVATFRQRPSEDDQEGALIVQDNEFGTAESDAHRRDFTINALLYDPLKHEIVDYCDGMRDVYHRVLRSIGDPQVRFREDPIRMLRAIKFAARLGLSFEPALAAALRSERLECLKAARPRFSQEVIRMLQGGGARRSYELLEELGFLGLLAPELAASWARDAEVRARTLDALGALDDLVTRSPREAAALDEGSLLALLWWPTYDALTAHLAPAQRQAKLLALRLTAPFMNRVRLSIKHLHLCARQLATLAVWARGRGAEGLTPVE